ncbi:hypothetical protein CU254_42195 (plasmid) [Amycolatopsis sp. AA4]|nr:hypothetical protein CU254_42195 [Amycolatopsis sp. AA4]
MTREHVLPDWLTGLGLGFSPVVHHAGPLNQVPREWSSKPFRTTVRMVCATCNNGWLSELERKAKPVLTPLIRGEPRRLSVDDQALIAAWTCKTALVSLLASATGPRPGGPPEEYTALYAHRDRAEPLPFSQYWIGSYTGDLRAASAWVTPFVIEAAGAQSPPALPSGYAMTLVLGRLLVQGVRFVVPALAVELVTQRGFVDIWPPTDTVPWPAAGFADDAVLDRMNRAQTLISQVEGVRLSAFTPATELPASTLDGTLIRLPLYCGKHEAAYPAELAYATQRTGRHYTFLTGCECPFGYIIRTEADGAHMKRWGDPAAVEAAYEEWPGEEFVVSVEHGIFSCKEED